MSGFLTPNPTAQEDNWKFSIFLYFFSSLKIFDQDSSFKVKALISTFPMKQYFTLEIFHCDCFIEKYRRHICEGSFFSLALLPNVEITFTLSPL